MSALSQGPAPQAAAASATKSASSPLSGPQPAGAASDTGRPPLLDVRALEVGYLTETGTVTAVNGVSFELGRGEILGIAGESGSGKSTIVQAITRLIAPPGVILGGSVAFHPRAHAAQPSADAASGEAVDILKLHADQLRALRWEQLAIVFQSAMNALNPVLTVETQILDGIAAHRQCSAADARTRARELLDLVGVPVQRLRSYPHELSGGMRQRVALAMALSLEPELVILDEPTTGLDVVVQRAILNRLLTLRRKLGFSVIFISHDLPLLLEICDQIIVLYAGRMMEVGPAAGLYRDPLHPYARGLRDAFPLITGTRTRLNGIPGVPPDLARPLPGCPFHPRCGHAFEPCRDQLPQLLTMDDRRVRCHLHDPAHQPADPAPPAITPLPAAGLPADTSPQPLAAVPPPESETVLEARNLVGRYRLQHGRRVIHAVEDVSISVQAGKVSAIVGESGSGKSTLLRLLALLESPAAGEIRLRGRAIKPGRRARQTAYREQVQIVFQDPFASMNPARTVEYHLDRPLRLHRPDLNTAARRARVVELLERVSLVPGSDFARRYPHELSGGQRQRVMIARALAVGPSVLLADEPISMLDVSMQVDVLNLLADLASQERLGMIYVTHNIASARYLADNIGVMYAGAVVESGPAAQVTERPAHPYTQLLLRSAPHPESYLQSDGPPDTASEDSGEPPDLAALPQGCRFHPRCPLAMQVCKESQPPQFPLSDGHWAACWLHRPGEG